MTRRFTALLIPCLVALAAGAQTPPVAPPGATAPVVPPQPPTRSELRRFMEQRNRVLVERQAPRPAIPIDGGQLTISGLGAFEPGLESQRLLGLRIRVEAPGLEGHEQVHYLDLHEIESLLRGFTLLRSVAAEGGRGFPTEARHLSIEGFGVGIALGEGSLQYRVHAGPDGEHVRSMSAKAFQSLENAVSTALDRLFNAP